MPWVDLEKHFARGVLFKVAKGIDILDVAIVMTRDDKESLKQWLEDVYAVYHFFLIIWLPMNHMILICALFDTALLNFGRLLMKNISLKKILNLAGNNSCIKDLLWSSVPSRNLIFIGM